MEFDFTTRKVLENKRSTSVQCNLYLSLFIIYSPSVRLHKSFGDNWMVVVLVAGVCMAIVWSVATIRRGICTAFLIFFFLRSLFFVRICNWGVLMLALLQIVIKINDKRNKGNYIKWITDCHSRNRVGFFSPFCWQWTEKRNEGGNTFTENKT